MSIRLESRLPSLRWRRLRRVIALFAPHVREHWRILSGALACGLGATLMQLLSPWSIKILFDHVLIPAGPVAGEGWLSGLRDVPRDTLIAGTALGLLAVAGLYGMLSYGQAFLTANGGQRVVFSLRRRVHAHLMRLSLSFHQRSQRGDLLMRLTGDINVLRDLLVDSLLMGLSQSILLVSMVAVMLAMDWPLALVAAGVIPLLALTMLRFSWRIRQAAKRQRRNEGRVAAQVGETLNGITAIQALSRERHQDRQFERSNRASLKAGLKTTRLEASMARLVEVLLAAGVASVLWYGVHRVQAGHLTPGELLVFISYVHSSYRPMRRLARASARASKAIACGDRLREILGSRPEVHDQPGAKRARALRGPLELRRVCFGYEKGAPVLRGVSFTVEHGSFTALVGPSGAGKSTVLALLLRLYDIEEGKILFDGRDIRKYRVQSLRDQIGIVLQEPILFGGTVSENIALGRLGATQAQIEEAALLANAHDFIRGLPRGYDTPLAEAGANLSGGQRQRIAIARAFVRDAPILLLDEPTFGLDARAEAEVSGAIARLMQGRTTLIIAHRLAAVQAADQVIVLRRGRVLECGKPGDLLAGGGWYARAWHTQWRCSVHPARGSASGVPLGQPSP